MSNFLENKNKIKKQLNETTNLKTTIESLQNDLGNFNQSEMESLDSSIFQFTDLVGCERPQLCSKIFSNMQEKLLNSIETLDSKTLENLLFASFPYLEFEDLKIVPLTILNKIEKIPDSILNKIANSPQVLKNLPIEIKRKVWEYDVEIFRKTIFPLFSKYLQLQNGNFSLTTQPTKKKTSIIIDLINLIGNSLKLYDLVLHFCRTLYVNTNNPSFCTFRSEILIYLHEIKLNELYDYDPCHYFCWWLEAYILKLEVNKFENRRIQDLRQFLLSLEINTPIWGDIAMILGSPIPSISMVRNIFYVLESSEYKFIVKSKKKPNGFYIVDEITEENLKLLSQLYLAGRNSQQMIKEKKYVFPIVDRDFIDLFYPIMIKCIFKDVPIDEEITFKLHYFIKMNPLAEKLILLSILYLMEKKIIQREKIEKILQIIALQDIGSSVFSKNDQFITDLFQYISNEEQANLIISELVKFSNISAYLHLKIISTLSDIVNVTHLGIIKEMVEIGITNQNTVTQVKKKYEVIYEKLKQNIDESQLAFLKEYLNKN
eukprot:gene4741-8324_t